jgi:uncharacterized membrane protein YgcG
VRAHQALLVLGALGLLALAPAGGCSTGAVGIDACRAIESARCEEAAACGFSPGEVQRCKLLYADQCLRGIENAAFVPSELDRDACVSAVRALGQCARDGTTQVGACIAAPVVDGAEAREVCTVLRVEVELLSACSWVASEVSAGGSGAGGSSAGGGGSGGSSAGGGGSAVARAARAAADPPRPTLLARHIAVRTRAALY